MNIKPAFTAVLLTSTLLSALPAHAGLWDTFFGGADKGEVEEPSKEDVGKFNSNGNNNQTSKNVDLLNASNRDGAPAYDPDRVSQNVSRSNATSHQSCAQNNFECLAQFQGFLQLQELWKPCEKSGWFSSKPDYCGQMTAPPKFFTYFPASQGNPQNPEAPYMPKAPTPQPQNGGLNPTPVPTVGSQAWQDKVDNMDVTVSKQSASYSTNVVNNLEDGVVPDLNPNLVWTQMLYEGFRYQQRINLSIKQCEDLIIKRQLDSDPKCAWLNKVEGDDYLVRTRASMYFVDNGTLPQDEKKRITEILREKARMAPMHLTHDEALHLAEIATKVWHSGDYTPLKAHLYKLYGTQNPAE